jgi:hypothetical protein
MKNSLHFHRPTVVPTILVVAPFFHELNWDTSTIHIARLYGIHIVKASIEILFLRGLAW